MTRQPHQIRRQEFLYGSATLARSQRLGAGSISTLEDVDVSRDETKSFAFHGDRRGSWFIDISLMGTSTYYKYAEGTFPSGGTIKIASFTEAVRFARARVAYSAAGSVTVHYGGLQLRRI